MPDTPPPSTRSASSTRSATSTRSRLPRWAKIAIISFLVVANLVALGALWALKTGQDILATADTDPEVAAVLDTATGDDLTFLIVGSDTREGLDVLTNFGTAGGARADVIMLVKIDSSDSSGQILSIPLATLAHRRLHTRRSPGRFPGVDISSITMRTA